MQSLIYKKTNAHDWTVFIKGPLYHGRPGAKQQPQMFQANEDSSMSVIPNPAPVIQRLGPMHFASYPLTPMQKHTLHNLHLQNPTPLPKRYR